MYIHFFAVYLYNMVISNNQMSVLQTQILLFTGGYLNEKISYERAQKKQTY